MDFIKSHSNYVLKKKHQTISDGTIWERDITTIGGVNQFSPSQIPIYKSNNFIITVRNDGKISNQYNQTKWKENESGDTWTLETISGMTSEFEDQNDVKIILKQDYYDFCDFAYYGSLTEMCRASINDVLKRFPGEMYVTEECAYYTTGITVDFEKIEDRVVLGDPKEKPKDDCRRRYIVDVDNKTSQLVCRRTEEVIESCKDVTDDRYVSNPFGIDAHSIKKPKDGKELKFFAENGYKNYMIIIGDGNGSDDDKITSWITRNFIKVIKNEEMLDNLYGGCAFYYYYLKPKILKFYFEQPDNEVWWMENNDNKITENSTYKGTTYTSPGQKGSKGYDLLVESFENPTGEVRQKFVEYETKWRIEEITTIEGDGCVCEKYSVKEEPYTTNKQDAINEANRLNNDAPSNVRYEARIGACCADIDCYIGTPCKGYKTASLTAKTASLTANGSTEIVIGAWIGDNNEIVYLSKCSEEDNKYCDIHIRPIEKFLVQFYNESDNFERIIVNMKTTPRYKAIFSVIKENERGYYRELETFIFPTSYGGYNLDASSFSFTEYTNRFAEIGAYYDELFTDNLYRAMTHEAIKNFDWTYTREFYYGDETEYVHGGEKIQKALRIFAREFDEIMSYINNIKNLNRVTYDERSNVPDYFLIDQVENKGWDVCLVYPYDLEEYYINDDGEKVYINSDSYDEDQQLDNEENGKKITRQFSQNTKKEVRPYRSELLDYPEGYFITCSDKGDTPCWYSGDKKSCYKKEGEESVQYKYLSAENSGNTYYDDDSRTLINRIKSFSDERSYTYMDANNEFMRRMAINSPYIWRHKGTIEGIEMILGMFGLKSKRWVEKMPEYRKWKWDGSECKDYEYDYEINEYSSFTNRIKEKWDAVHQMYRIDWINSTKTIVYDNRLKSNYTKYGANNNYTSYQGLPVLYRNEYIEYEWDEDCKRIKLYKDKECTDAYKCDDKIDSTKIYKKVVNEPYIKISPLKYDEEQDVTDNKNNDAFKRIDENNAPVIIRYLYPNFDKNDELDGNPYFQMKGGWMSKTVQNGINKDGDETNRYNFQYDVDDNVAYTCYVTRGSDEDDKVKDNHFLYKETIRNIKRVDTIADLIATPINTVKDGTIFYVTNVESGIAIVDNEVFYIKYEYNSEDNDKPYRYVSLIKENDYIKVGDEKFFTYTIIVYDKEGNEALYDLTDKEDGYEVKAYILYEDEYPQFICKADYDGIYTIDSFMILDDKVTSATTNYFIIDDSFYSNRLATEEVRNGWRRLEETDQEYIKVNTIINYYEGNNPHNGNMDYDSGHNYFTHFKRLFKTPIDNELFDERCYESFYYDLDNEINEYGFRNLIEDNEMIKQYFPFISGLTESKIHYFGSYYKSAYDTSDKCARKSASALTKCENVLFYGENKNKIQTLEAMYQKSQSSAITVSGYILSDTTERDNLVEGMIGGTPYSASNMVDIDKDEIDEVTNQILNNKRLTIKFYLHNCWHSNQGQCELKYLDSIVMNYLTQMIPSTTIFDVQYIGCCDEQP